MKFVLKDNGNRNISKNSVSKVGQKFISTLMATLNLWIKNDTGLKIFLCYP